MPIQSAWEYRHAHGKLTNRHLLSTGGLNVKRSSFVCALLARPPEVVCAIDAADSVGARPGAAGTATPLV